MQVSIRWVTVTVGSVDEDVKHPFVCPAASGVADVRHSGIALSGLLFPCFVGADKANGVLAAFNAFAEKSVGEESLSLGFGCPFDDDVPAAFDMLRHEDLASFDFGGKFDHGDGFGHGEIPVSWNEVK